MEQILQNQLEETFGLSGERAKQFNSVFAHYWKVDGPKFPNNCVGLVRNYNQNGDRIQSICYLEKTAVYIEENLFR